MKIKMGGELYFGMKDGKYDESNFGDEVLPSYESSLWFLKECFNEMMKSDCLKACIELHLHDKHHLPTRVILLHQCMSFHRLLKLEHFPNRNLQFPLHDSLHQLI